MRTHTGKFTGRVTRPHHRVAGIAEVRARLTGLQLNPRLAPFARAEIEAADSAVLEVEQLNASDDGAAELVAAARESVEHAYRVARSRYSTALARPTQRPGSSDD